MYVICIHTNGTLPFRDISSVDLPCMYTSIVIRELMISVFIFFFPRAVWLDPESYPCCWQLDPTEGPGRVRRRLQRCHLHIPRQFFLPPDQARHTESYTRPLGFLFDSASQSQSSSELKRRLQMNEKISHSSSCTHVTPATETRGELLLGSSGMYFVGEEPLRNIIYASMNQVCQHRLCSIYHFTPPMFKCLWNPKMKMPNTNQQHAK